MRFQIIGITLEGPFKDCNLSRLVLDPFFVMPGLIPWSRSESSPVQPGSATLLDSARRECFAPCGIE